MRVYLMVPPSVEQGETPRFHANPFGTDYKNVLMAFTIPSLCFSKLNSAHRL